jgi:hypothetical protein
MIGERFHLSQRMQHRMARNEGQYGGWLCQNMRRSNKFYEFKMAEI